MIDVLEWGRRFAADPAANWSPQVALARYNRLACDSHFRGSEEASRLLYRVRTGIERTIEAKLEKRHGLDPAKLCLLGDAFGQSTKQGVSFRMPLTTCQPTRLCMVQCYAHDGKDLLKPAVTRGVINGMLGALYEVGSRVDQERVMEGLRPHVDKAVAAAFEDAQKAKAWGFSRRPRIRFSHVGDISAYPKFANTLAWVIWNVSYGQVDVTTYTRHQGARLLDQEFIRINFSLDPSTPKTVMVPAGAKTTFACFNGRTRRSAHVNFAEHHGPLQVMPRGEGFVCPSTIPGRPHGCDQNRCDRCFTRAS